MYGDVAILSYNYVGYTKNKDGKVEPDLAKVNPRLCEEGRKMDAGARQLCPSQVIA